MATFTCERYPQLSVRRKGTRVQFQNGTLEAGGTLADEVRSIADRYGIVETTAEEPKPEPKRQTRAKRDEPASSD